MRRKRKITLLLLPVVLTGLFFVYQNAQTTKVAAVNHLEITYDGMNPPDPVFNIIDILPGDCVTKTVEVKHLSGEAVEIAVRSRNEEDTDNLASQLSFVIRNGSVDIYGGVSETGERTVEEFFSSSNPTGIVLATFNGNESKTFDLEVCFDISAGNEYQGTKVVFDLKFFEKKPPIQLPEECSELTGIITEIIEGTEGKDKIKGTSASELIMGKGGDDKLYGNGGDDCIIGGEGDDRIEGGTGTDI